MLACLGQSALARDAKLGYGAPPAELKAQLGRLVTAYPDTISGYDKDALILKDGTRLPISDGRTDKTFEQLLNAPDIDDMFAFAYQAGAPAKAPAVNFDPGRVRVEALAHRLGDHIPRDPPPALLHGDLWAGNLLVRGGRLAAFIDPACYHGHAEVDLAMLCLFSTPPEEFWAAYGARDGGWEARLAVYQLFPALVHLRLFGTAYAPMAERLLGALGV